MARHVAKGSARRSSTARPATEAQPASARADLRLVLQNRRLQLLCAGAVVVCFGGYFAILLGIGRLRDWLLLIVFPAVPTGVIIGALLDMTYTRMAAQADPAAGLGRHRSS
jgi:hypothetical protein